MRTPACEGVYRRQVEWYLAHLEVLLGGDADAGRRARIALSTRVGAVLVARALDDRDRPRSEPPGRA
ncbi:MAG TPA: hypothetical protein VG165_15020 [Solirubrobacteraceae bacterium]|nr:hypothetical protein [Solirubrobacteraceae bacterium]